MLGIDVMVADDRWRAELPDVDDTCRRAAAAAWARTWGVAAADPAAEASLMLADDDRLAALNRDYRGQDGPTNVLSFPLQVLVAGDPPPAAGRHRRGPPLHLGDVAIAYETTLAEATRDARPLADHLCHLVVHGILHLMGYDHQTDLDAQRMEALETGVLADLGIADPYADHDP